jgi:hypothetical protein
MVAKILLIAGPPRAGKDTLAFLLEEKYRYRNDIFTRIMILSTPLKLATHFAFDVPNKLEHAYEHCKDEPHEDFLGLTPRQAYIHHAEEYMRKLYGRNVYTNILIKKIERSLTLPVNKSFSNGLFIVPGAGFQEEVDTLINTFGSENTMLIMLNRTDTDYANDSRYAIKHPDPARHVELVNNSEKESLLLRAHSYIQEFLNV